MFPAQNMESTTVRIPVRSRRQAMDWSLVLASQAIETTILPPDENGGWALLIPARDSERAFKSLRQYRVENRGWRWGQDLLWPAAHFNWGGVVWAALLVLFYWLSARNPDFLTGGIMDSARVLSGQWWRVFTAMTLHADLGHLATNLSIGIVLFGLVMGQFGVGTGLLAAYLAGVGGNVASLLLNAKPFHGLGASGMVMGALGLLAAQSLHPANRHPVSRKYLLSGLAAGIMLFILFGLSPGSDVVAHFGGFLTGLLFGAVLVYSPKGFFHNPRINFVSIVLLTALVTSTWLLALRHSQ